MALNSPKVGTDQSSTFNKDAATIIWVLNNFTKMDGSRVYSPNFSPTTKNSRLVFRLGHDWKMHQCDLTVFVYLYPLTAREKLNLEYEVSILDFQSKKRYTKMFRCLYDPFYDHPCCSASLISYSQVIGRTNGLIPDDRMTLFCQVKILNDRDFSETIHRSVKFDSKINENFQFSSESGKLSDITLVVGKRSFSVHKSILAAQSVVFATMFEDEETKDVYRMEIVDICAEVFQVLLHYIYTGEIVQKGQYVEELFVAADKYQLESLKLRCEQSLCISLTTESVINILVLADMHNSPQLKANCIDYITEHSIYVMETDGWKQLAKRKPELLLELYRDLAVKAYFHC